MIIEILKIVDADCEGGFRVINRADLTAEDVVINASEGLSVGELRDALTAKAIDIPEGAKKADLQTLLDTPQ